MNSRLSFALIALASLTATVPDSRAMPPLTRRTFGIIERVDLAQKQLVIRGDTGAKPLTLTFDHRTRIWRDSQTATADAFTRGQAVEVSHRLPFFGPDYASRIVLLSRSQIRKSPPKRSPQMP